MSDLYPPGFLEAQRRYENMMPDEISVWCEGCRQFQDASCDECGMCDYCCRCEECRWCEALTRSDYWCDLCECCDECCLCEDEGETK